MNTKIDKDCPEITTENSHEIRPEEIDVCAFIGARCKPVECGQYTHTSLTDVLNNACEPDKITGFDKLYKIDPKWQKQLNDAVTLRSEAIFELDNAKKLLRENEASEEAKKALDCVREKFERLKKSAIGVAFICSARFDKDRLDNVTTFDERILLLDVDIDAKDVDESIVDQMPIRFEADPHIIAYWQSRRGEGYHGLFVTRCGGAHYEKAKRYILEKWPFADKNALTPKHTFFVFPGWVKQKATIYEATPDEIAEIKADLWQKSQAQTQASSSPADNIEVSDTRKKKYFEKYFEGLVSDCAHLTHNDMTSVAMRCGNILRECGCIERLNECAQVIYKGCSGKGHITSEKPKDVVNQIKYGIDHGTEKIDWKHETPSTQASYSSKPVSSSQAETKTPLPAGINEMNSCRKEITKKDGTKTLEFERGDISPICAFLKARGVYKELFTLDNGLRTASGEELTSEVLTGEQLIMQQYGLPALGVGAPRLCMQAAKYVCEQNQKDSLRQYIEELPVWDGVDRISEFWQTYTGAIAGDEKEAQYLRSVARYMFTAIIGRALATRESPCKADMAIILEGATGIGKTSLVKALCARKEWYKTLSLDLPEDEYKRALRMTQIVEIGEMGEPNNKQLQAIKRILSSELLSMRKKGVDDFFYFPVRAFTIATIDQTDVLNDGAGARRWLPVKANGVVRDEKDGHLYIDCEGVKRDLLQLYAQGKTIYDKSGVVWYEINKDVQKAHTDSLTVADERAERVINWMQAQRKQSASLEEIAINCLEYSLERFGMKEQKELARSLRLSGFTVKNTKYGGIQQKRWFPKELEIDSGYDSDERF